MGMDKKSFDELIELGKEIRDPKLLKSLILIANMQKRMDNKAKGFEPKCKVCTHKAKDEIHRLHELGYTNRDTMRELELFNDFTEQALGRHLNKHYPLSKKFHEKIRLIQEKEIQEAIKSYPPIADYLLDEDPEYTDIFLNSYGFCFDNHYFCELIPKKTLLSSIEVIDRLRVDFENIKDNYGVGKQDDIIKIMAKLNKCYSCRLFNIQASYGMMFEYIFLKLFNKDVEFGNDILPVINYSEYDRDYLFDELDKLLEKKA